MGQIDPAAHTIKSHGASLARNHLHDWLILLLLLVIEVVLFAIHPFYRFVGRDMMEDLRYPMKDNTVPVWAVPVSILHKKNLKLSPFNCCSLVKGSVVAFFVILVHLILSI